jgi:hypothetical protein
MYKHYSAPALRGPTVAPSRRALIWGEGLGTIITSADAPLSKGTQRFEVFTGGGKWREWPPEMKASVLLLAGMSSIFGG